MVVQLYTSIPMLKLCIRLGIWRYDGPERHEILTVINAYYGYCKILQVGQILHYTSINVNVQSSTFSTGNPLIQMQ